ncbi:MAG: hypothetical protein QXL15_03135 [Candidatus Korarchaeota archaeon]
MTLINLEGKLSEYFSKVEKACGNTDSYIVEINSDKVSEILNNIAKKAVLLCEIEKIVRKYKMEDYQITFFRSGKLVLNNVSGVNELFTLLNKIIE